MKYSARLEKSGNGYALVFPDFPELRAHVADPTTAATVAHGKLNGYLGALLARGQLPLRPAKAPPGARSIAVSVQPHHALALQVRWVRQEQGLTLESVAAKMGVSRQRVAVLEGPDCNWTLTTLRRLSDALDADLDIVLRPRRR